MRAETEAVVCSGPFSGGKQTYALLEERVPPVPELHPDEALAKLATAYFRSHSPASMQDFVWWSGLSVTEARHSVGLIGRSLTAERFGQRELFVHESCRAAETSGVPLYLLPGRRFLVSGGGGARLRPGPANAGPLSGGRDRR